MDPKNLEQLLEEVQAGRLSVAEALERLRHLPFEDLGFARIDHHRALRQGFPEVVFAAGKDAAQLKGILASLADRADHILMTRLAPDKAEFLLAVVLTLPGTQTGLYLCGKGFVDFPVINITAVKPLRVINGAMA